MSRRTLLIGVLALVCGVSAAVMIHTVFGSSEAPPPEVVQVAVVAKDEIPRYSMLTRDMVKMRPCPKELVPAGALLRLEDVVERMTRQTLIKDDILVEGRLFAKNAAKGMANEIPKGMRACTILTPTVSNSVAGFIRPGNRVDVLWTLAMGAGDTSGGGRTSTLIQDAEIWAVDQFVDQPNNGKPETRELRSVTLLVTPQQALDLNLGQNSGKLHLVLRNPEDSVTSETQAATLRNLQGLKDRPQVAEVAARNKAAPPVTAVEAPAAPRLGTIRTVRGSFESKVTVILPADTDAAPAVVPD